MALIGVRELRERTAEILRKVREEQAEYVITYQGRPIALLLPVDTEAVEAAVIQASKQTATGEWEAYAQLAEMLRQEWPSGQSTQEIIDHIRED
ncbi:MAG TPA: type II toxin-antitoxin system prevent-host-death family antitoxin [Anaerolineales bacterium]|nr:type II toxin-antitoxin system prevent-host-death family antitoxin [Anaerolineales bacterium]